MNEIDISFWFLDTHTRAHGHASLAVNWNGFMQMTQEMMEPPSVVLVEWIQLAGISADTTTPHFLSFCCLSGPTNDFCAAEKNDPAMTKQKTQPVKRGCGQAEEATWIKHMLIHFWPFFCCVPTSDSVVSVVRRVSTEQRRTILISGPALFVSNGEQGQQMISDKSTARVH